MTLEHLIIAASVPSAVVGGAVSLMFWRLKKQIEANEAAQNEREKTRLAHETNQVKLLSATATLCKANAIALQNGRCNGETHAALAYLEEVKHEQRSFLMEQGLEHIYERL
ncbi:MAG: hypothetical protein IKZ08_03070 [Bacteroidales bacterium]|nr:hypothetical protein [Bacteroidales bacterium]